MANGIPCIARPYRPSGLAIWERIRLAAMVFCGKLDTVCFMDEEDALLGKERVAREKAIDDRRRKKGIRGLKKRQVLT